MLSPVFFLIALCLFLSARAFASIGVEGAGGINTSGVTLGGEYTFTLSPLFEAGGSYDHTFLRYGSGAEGALDFYSLILRVKVPELKGLYADLKAGLMQKSVGESGSVMLPAAGMGLGYRIPIGESVEIGPRVGVRSLPNSASLKETATPGALLEAGVLVSFHF